MRSVDNLFAFVERLPELCKDETDVKEKLETLPSRLDWSNALEEWQEFSGYADPVNVLKQTGCDNPSQGGQNGTAVTSPDVLTSCSDVKQPGFRVTCNRSGRQHSFSSPQAAAYFGGGVDDYFDWKVNLSEPDIEIILNISGDSATIGIALTKESLHKRDIKHFGVMTLRSTIAHGLLR